MTAWQVLLGDLRETQVTDRSDYRTGCVWLDEKHLSEVRDGRRSKVSKTCSQWSWFLILL